MFLDLTKAFSFFACIVVVYHAAIHTFFVPGARWEERLSLALVKLALAACVSFLSGMVFTWPSHSNPDRALALTATLPVRFFLWSTVVIAGLFLGSWFLGDLAQQAAPFISSRTLQRF
jgi:hypothetical protein